MDLEHCSWCRIVDWLSRNKENILCFLDEGDSYVEFIYFFFLPGRKIAVALTCTFL